MTPSMTHLVTQLVDLVIVRAVGVDHDGVRVSVDDIKVKLLHQVSGMEQDLPALAWRG